MREPELDRIRRQIEAGFAQEGFPITRPVAIAIRKDLPPAATTFRDGERFVILVSDRAAESDDVALLLAHELGHVQRMDSGHASHDDDAITAAYAAIEPRLRHEYERRTIHHAINFTQDLYADPLSLRVARRLGLVAPGAIEALIAGFTNDEPYEIDDPLARRWDQTEDMVGNARAIALARLADAPQARERAERRQGRYLARIAPDIAREAPWFQARLDDLPEDVTREAFAQLLVEYVRRFVATAGLSADGR
ncbi:MAG: hypothetical protein QOE90_2089 [Thermoplasmata archaeon]|nr:hypothetical protein [Thermoplasmata archaeon]